MNKFIRWATMMSALALSACGNPVPRADSATSDIWKVFEDRIAVRRFLPDAIPTEDLNRIVLAACTAPSSGNQQPWRFLVVTDKEKIQAMKTACVEVGFQVDYESYFSAPAYIVVLTNDGSLYPDYNHWDGPIAAGYILLAARALGYGTVFITDVIPESVTKQALGIPDGYTRVCVIPLGKPDPGPVPDALAAATTPGQPSQEVLRQFLAFQTLGE